MNHEITKTKVITSLLWKLLERSGTQGVQFAVMIILARLVLPEEFGLIVLVLTFITFANILTQSGFNSALLQKKVVDETDYSSVFYFSLINAALLFLILFFSAPLIADFFDQQDFTLVLRVLSITLFFGTFNSIQYAVIAREFQFKKLFKSSLIAICIAGVLGITLAYAGFGIWALVLHQITNQCLVTLILWFTVKWRPKLLFSFNRVKHLLSFGWKLMAASLIDSFEMQLRNLLIGKIFTPSMLGYYNRGDSFPNVLVSNVNGAIQSVMFPVLASYQDDQKMMKEIVRRSIVTSSFIIFPMMVGLLMIAKPLIELILTEKWLPAVPFLQIFCAAYALWPIHTANLQAISALGRSDIFLKLEIIKGIIGVIILGISIPFGEYAIALGVFINSLISAVINSFPNMKLLNYSFIEQLKDIYPSLLLSLGMGGVVFMVHLFNMTFIFTIIIQIILGVVVYVGCAKVFQFEPYNYLKTTLRDSFRSWKESKLKEEV